MVAEYNPTLSWWEGDSDDDEDIDAMEERIPWLQDKRKEEEDEYPQEIPREFRCIISLDVMVIPVYLNGSDAKNARYEKSAVEHWLGRRPNRCPITNHEHPMPLTIVEDVELRQRIEAWRMRLGLEPKKKNSPCFGRLDAGGAVTRCINALNKGDLNDAEDAARALSRLCEFDDRCRIAARHRGALDLLIGILRRRDFIPESMKEACAWALANLARNGDNRFLIARSGGVCALGQVVELATNDNTREAGALALARMAKTYKYWVVPAARPLVYVLSLTAAGHSALLAAASALWALSAGSDATKRDVVDAGAVPVLVHILRKSSLNGCCAPIRSSPGTQSNHRDGFTPTNNTNALNPSPPQICRHRLYCVAGWAIINLACSSDRRVRRNVQLHLGVRWFPFMEPSRPLVKRHVQRLVDRRTAAVS